MRLWIVAAVAAALAFAAKTGEGGLPAFAYTAAPRYNPTALLSGGERFPSGAAIILASRSGRQKLAPRFSASADPAVSFDGRNILFAGKITAPAHWQIWEVPASGGEPHLIVRSEGDCVRPLYLPDGRIVYTRISSGGSQIEIASMAGGAPQQITFAPGRHITDDVLRDGRILYESDGELFTVYPDGTGVESLRCDHGPRRRDARQLLSGDIVFTAGGRLARFTSALASQAEIDQPKREPAGSVAEIAADRWIVSLLKPGGVTGLYLWNRNGGRLVPIETPVSSHALQPVVVQPRVPPKQFPSALVETRKTGNLLCLNARASKEPISGEVRTVQLYTRDESGSSILLGRQAVAGDGSFYVEVPADRPLQIELLDSAGRTVRAERGWFWMRPSEQRVCVGCHTGPERAPENKVPEILLRSTVPEKMLGPTK